MNILVINCGSSSIKYSIINGKTEKLVQAGKIEKIGEKNSKYTNHDQALAEVTAQISELEIAALGYRIVHGGDKYSEAVKIDQGVISEIKNRIPDAPMHNPYGLKAIEVMQKKFPSATHVAVFDTAFHARMPRRAYNYALDFETAKKHKIRRYGFHGTSHSYVSSVAAEFLKKSLKELRIISLHLGNGASACAVEFGCSTETSMGHTPLEGLVMGTRCGDIDSGVVLSLLRSGQFDPDSLDTLLNKQSGLLGISGISNDVRDLENSAEAGEDRARLAINIFAHRARKYIGAYAAAMGGVDCVLFTGGIGENSKTMRRRILQRLEFLGLSIDEDKNLDVKVSQDQNCFEISSQNSKVKCLVVKTNEELMIARETAKLSRFNIESSDSAGKTIPIAISARHAHLDQETFEAIFGKGATLTHLKDLSQPGQFAAEETIDLIGPRNKIESVRILGPLRKKNQIEISRTDEFKLGLDAPVRDSGNVEASAPITIKGPKGTIKLKEGLICARRHIHMHPNDAKLFNVKDKDELSVAIQGGSRDLIFGDVLVRVKESYKLEMHIDTDEGNAAELSRKSDGEMVYENIDSAVAELSRQN